MMHLYHCQFARSFRPLWTFEELGLDYELTLLPFPPRVHAKQYLAVNPLGTVPFFVDGATEMTESAAICQYIATVQGPSDLVVNPGEPGYGAWLNALHQGEATLTFPQTLVLRYGRYEPAPRQAPQIVEDYSSWFIGRTRWIDQVLQSSDYMAADRFTVADISVGYALMLAEITGLFSELSPSVQGYWKRLAARPGCLRALAAERADEKIDRGKE